jgi:hypothetical protein
MRLLLAAGSGGVLPQGDDDVVAEGLELAAGVAGLAAAVGVPGVPVRAEVAVAGGGVVQQVPDDDQDGPADGAAGLLAAAAAGVGGQAAEPLAEEGVGVRGGAGGQALLAGCASAATAGTDAAQAALKCLYLAVTSLDPTGKGRKRWTNRWKAALNAFDITFDGRLSPDFSRELMAAAGGCRSGFRLGF